MNSYHFYLLAILNGLSYSSVLFLMSVGFSLVFGLMRIINISHAALFVLGAYLGIYVHEKTGNFLLAVLAAGCAIALIGFLQEKFLINRFHGKEFEQVLLTIGLLFVINDIILAVFGGYAVMGHTPAVLRDSVGIFGVQFPKYRVVVIGTGIIASVVVWFLIERTKAGAAIRAGADNEEIAKAVGIDINKVFLATFTLATLIAGIGGMVAAPVMSFEPGAAFDILTLALVVVTVGGAGTVVGAVVGSLFVGMVDSFGRAFFPSLSYFTMFVPMAVILILRPQGLLGRR